MHNLMEIIVPPHLDPVEAIGLAMDPYNMNHDSEDFVDTFFDYYNIGGRWSGTHLKSKLGLKRLQIFENEILQIKPGLRDFPNTPEDKKRCFEIWGKHFPEVKDSCPFWGNQAPEGTNEDYHFLDITTVGELGDEVKCATFAIINCYGESFKNLIHLEEWNGEDWELTGFNGVKEELLRHPSVRKDWWIVTLDYHS